VHHSWTSFHLESWPILVGVSQYFHTTLEFVVLAGWYLVVGAVAGRPESKTN